MRSEYQPTEAGIAPSSDASSALTYSDSAVSHTNAPAYPLWGKLEPGPYAVGYDAYFTYDYSRVYNPVLLTDYHSPQTGLTFHNDTPPPKRHRPILVNIWYPAVPDSESQFMRHGEYLALETIRVEDTNGVEDNGGGGTADVLSAVEEPCSANVADANTGRKDDTLQNFIQELIAFQRDVISQEVMNKPLNELSDEENAIFSQFLDTKTAAIRQAAPTAGRFPVIINHQGLGGAFEDNTVLFEFLASHGYVIANSAYQSENAAYLNIDWDLNRSVKDMEFLLNVLRGHPCADMNKVGVMGQSYGGQAAMAWRAETNSVVDAVVSLDSTLEYAPVGEPGFGQLTEKLQQVRNMTAPMLLFASKKGQPNFSHYSGLRYAKRYYATVDYLQHNDYISHGAIGSDFQVASLEQPAECEQPAQPALDEASEEAAQLSERKEVRKSYAIVCLHTLCFLNAYLKKDKGALQFLQAKIQELRPNSGRENNEPSTSETRTSERTVQSSPVQSSPVQSSPVHSHAHGDSIPISKADDAETSRFCLQFEDAQPLPPTAKQLIDMVLDGGLVDALEYCQRLARPSGGSLSKSRSEETLSGDAGIRENAFVPDVFLEAAINDAGYGLLRAGRGDSATALFKLNAEIHPASYNAHASLGSAYEKAGDVSAAYASYQQALTRLADNPRLNEDHKQHTRQRLLDIVTNLEKGASRI
jgi:pimeloyl-ACP methyl ester carboxylesterase